VNKLVFALFFGNRGFFPGELVDGARRDIRAIVHAMGHETIELEQSLTRFGAVETMGEGRVYAKFLDENRGKYDGVILSLPNFGDENGAVAALRDCGVPILLQAYPDTIGNMDFANRRDAFCGKLSIADVFRQEGIAFSAIGEHVCHPDSDEFSRQLSIFAGTCAVVKRMRRLNVGAIGARTTVFKTIRFDEVALQGCGINTETFDLTQLFRYMRNVDPSEEAFVEARKKLINVGNCVDVPAEMMDNQARLYCALKQIAAEYELGAMAIRCWNELQDEFKITPCISIGLLNAEGLPVACELDVCNAVSMVALQAASGMPPICMDWNNNYGSNPDKCILFHCGAVSSCAIEGKGTVVSHKMLDKGKEHLGGIAWGCNQGRVKPGPMTYVSAKTESGRFVTYLGQGRITEDKIEEAFFGCAGVAEIPELQKTLRGICKNGFRHHVSIVLSHAEESLREAFNVYLGYDIIDF